MTSTVGAPIRSDEDDESVFAIIDLLDERRQMTVFRVDQRKQMLTQQMTVVLAVFQLRPPIVGV
jgi:hypothetical protein